MKVCSKPPCTMVRSRAMFGEHNMSSDARNKCSSLVIKSSAGKSLTTTRRIGPTARPEHKLKQRWKEYQGIQNWDGMLDPLDDNLRSEILRYGSFVDVAYKSFDFDTSSSLYGCCKYSKSVMFDRCEVVGNGYKVTKHLYATSGIKTLQWMKKNANWMTKESSWIGYVAVCQDEREIARLGRRDVVIAFRGTATCLEWLENLRATLTPCNTNVITLDDHKQESKVESGFLSLYTSHSDDRTSLQKLVRQEITRIIEAYGNEPLSVTITGHSLGAALATLTAYDIKKTIKHCPLVTVISFGGPRVGNLNFRHELELQGTKILRIVNSNDVITKVPGFVVQDGCHSRYRTGLMKLMKNWLQKKVEETQWVYAEVGNELRLSSSDSPYLEDINVAKSHDLKTYLHLVDGFVSSSCPFRSTARRLFRSQN